VVRVQSKSAAAESQAISPAVSTIRILSEDRLERNASISRLTHGEAFASGEASSTRNSESPSARAIDFQSAGLADRLVLSRNTRRAATRYHGRANR
jgi:hypothetical protein